MSSGKPEARNKAKFSSLQQAQGAVAEPVEAILPYNKPDGRIPAAEPAEAAAKIKNKKSKRELTLFMTLAQVSILLYRFNCVAN